jgi:rod shape-determining protein MreC
MSNSRLKYIILVIVLAAVSINYADGLRGLARDLSAVVLKEYTDVRSGVESLIDQHFEQADEIEALKSRNAHLEEQVMSLSSYALKLDALLGEAKLGSFRPRTQLVRALSYASLGDYNRVWLDFEGFDATKIYGLIYQGYTAGIIAESGGRPLGLLQFDPKCTFSVAIGSERIKGIAFGADNRLEVRFIPLWTEPKEGDEVTTSGLDGIFFEGVKVGIVTEVHKDESYFTAVIKPYADIKIPSFFHAALVD